MMTTTTTTNATTTTRYEDLIENDLIRYTLIVLHVTGIVTSVVGNGFLIGYVALHARGPRRRRPPNATAYLILNLATCDLVKSLVHEPMRLVDVLAPYGSFRDTMEFCQISGFVILFVGCVGFHTIVAISGERLLLICYPLTAKRWLTRAAMFKVLGVIWAVAFCSALPFPVMFSYRASLTLRSQTYRFCTINIFEPSLPQARHYYIFIFTAYYALPAVVVAASYVRIFRSLYRSGDTGGACATGIERLKDETILRMLKHRRLLAKMMVAIAVCFAVFEGPLFLVYLYVSLGNRITKNVIFLKLIIEWLPMLSSVVNPVVYATRAKTFRRSLAIGGSGMALTFGGQRRYDDGCEGVSLSSPWRRTNTGPRGVRLKPRPTPVMTQPLAARYSGVLKRTVVVNPAAENEDRLVENEEGPVAQL